MKRPTSKDTKKLHPSGDVEAYIRAAPKASRTKLLQLRRIVKAVAPGAKEGISYRMPYYDYHGALVWFAAFKNHIGMFVRPPVIQEHKQELKAYETTKSAVHFPMNQPLPIPIIRKLIKARIVKNKAARDKK
jgi:uncharacterized protein YdhG (YjbR/CyaY superfamily)